MATTQTNQGMDQLKGASVTGELHCYQIPIKVKGTYLTGTKPNFDILAILQEMHMGISAIVVKSVTVFRDYNDGTNRYTAPNANIALSSTGNKVVTFRMDSGATNGSASAEIADGTALDGVLVFIVVCEVTGA